MRGSDKLTGQLSGLFVVDKSEGPISMGIVARVRRLAGGARTGHSGTLDPLATGVLVLGLGSATRALTMLTGLDKRYLTTIDLSSFTTTDDRAGTLLPVDVARPPERDEVDAALAKFRGAILQAPPAFSAVKVGGQRAYALARAGRAPELAPRPVVVHSIALRNFVWPCAEIEIHCGKGFYVRRLARDLGAVLGTGGHCLSIRRTAVGPYTLEHARPMEGIERIQQEDLLPAPTAAPPGHGAVG